MPLPLLAQAAHNDTISSDLQLELAIGAWVRAILLDNEKVALEMIPILKELAPELREGIKVYQSAPSGAAKKFAAALLLLKFPGMGPHWGSGFLREQQLDEFGMYRSNWWCQVGPPPSFSGSYPVVRYFDPKAGMSESLKNLYQEAHLTATSFMNAQEIQAGEEDWKKLAALPTGPNYLAQIVIDWSKSHRNDPRVPEALYLAGRATRNGCVDHDTTKYSREIFEILHRRFPHTEWAQKTPYWYKY